MSAGALRHLLDPLPHEAVACPVPGNMDADAYRADGPRRGEAMMTILWLIVLAVVIYWLVTERR